MLDQVKYFSFNKQSDWEKGLLINLQNTPQGLSLSQEGGYGVYRTISPRQVGWLDAAVGICTLRGKLLFLDTEAALSFYDYQNQYSEILLRGGHGYFSAGAMLAASGEVLYVCDAAGERKVSAYSLANAQTLWVVNEIEKLPLVPLTMAVDEEQNVYVVTPDLLQDNQGRQEILPGTGLVVWKIRAGKVVDRFSEALTFRLGKSKYDLREKSFYAAVSAQGRLHVLDGMSGVLYIFTPSGRLEARHELPGDRYGGMCADSRGNIFIGDRRSVTPGGDDDRFILKFSPDGKLQERVSGYRGRADILLMDDHDMLYVWDGQQNFLSILILRPKMTKLEESGLAEGFFISTAIDSGEKETVWHRIVLDAEVPDETQLHISCYASDRPGILKDGKYLDLDSVIMDGTMPLLEKKSLLEGVMIQEISNPRDALLMQLHGRYLWLKIHFSGGEESTPLLKKMRIYFPRRSLLPFLPAVYQEDPVSKDFLERFLALFDTFLLDMEEQIGDVARYFDVETAPIPFLKWLAAWLGIAVNAYWDDEQLKALIRDAPELYRKRGTREAISRMLEIYTGVKPFIVEYFQFKHLLKKAEFKSTITALYGDDPYTFCVLLPAKGVQSEQQRVMVEKIVQEQKPAFTEARIVVLQPWIYVDLHTYLGINTYLSERSLPSLDRQSFLPYDTVLIDLDRDKRLGIHTRLELDAALD